MKFSKFFFSLVAVFAFTACGDDNKTPDEPTPGPAEVKITSCSVAEGAEVDADEISEIRVTYNAAVTLNTTDRITLNGSRLNASVDGNNTVVLPVNLTKGTEYQLVIPAHAVIADGGACYGPALTINFKTIVKGIDPAEPGNFAPLTNTSATAEAKNVYNFLIEQYGKKIVSGAMANVDNNNDFADWINSVTGKYPALTGYDFIHLKDSKPGAWIDYSDITPAKTQWQNNGLVTYMWHWSAPDAKDSEKYGFYIPGKGDDATNFDIREALKEGTWQHDFILADIDKVAETLRLLQDAGIPVLWRPLHEAAGDYRYGAWFWWGAYGYEYTKQLWILMHDRLVNHHGLNNLIWVWTAQYQTGYEAQMKASYPGDEYVDIVGVDLYPDNDGSQVTAYRAALDMTSGKKLVCLAEIGRVPSPEKCMTDGAYWAWFMEWYTYNIDNNATVDGFNNTRDAWKQIMASPFVITRDRMPDLK